MHDETDIIEILTALANETDGQTPCEKPGVTPPIAQPEETSITLKIERDLAVMLIGSDAGRCERIKPHSAMTFGSSPQETLHVSVLMEPFLRDEIRRVKLDKAHRPRCSEVRTTVPQALALKAFCLRYAAFLRNHLDNHARDDRVHRSRQRLDQA
jgi:hypothetical protein